MLAAGTPGALRGLACGSRGGRGRRAGEVCAARPMSGSLGDGKRWREQRAALTALTAAAAVRGGGAWCDRVRRDRRSSGFVHSAYLPAYLPT